MAIRRWAGWYMVLETDQSSQLFGKVGGCDFGPMF
jgi:hypothetical protein